MLKHLQDGRLGGFGDDDVALLEREAVMRRPLASLLNMRTRKALNAWAAITEEAIEAMRKLRSAGASMRALGVRKALTACAMCSGFRTAESSAR